MALTVQSKIFLIFFRFTRKRWRKPALKDPDVSISSPRAGRSGKDAFLTQPRTGEKGNDALLLQSFMLVIKFFGPALKLVKL
ncbi:MAG: hypothetical protein DMG06_09330 [Acidobacteria bacterium]|nr:MAG: hypothetical protein DMG06_09330 [Acidobacteriota bacterium]